MNQELTLDHFKGTNIAKGFVESSLSAQLDDFLEKGKALPIGTKKTYGGKPYIKTANGWRPEKKGSSAHSEEQDESVGEDKQQKDDSVSLDEKINNIEKRFQQLHNEDDEKHSTLKARLKNLQSLSEDPKNHYSGNQGVWKKKIAEAKQQLAELSMESEEGKSKASPEMKLKIQKIITHGKSAAKIGSHEEANTFLDKADELMSTLEKGLTTEFEKAFSDFEDSLPTYSSYNYF